MTSEEQITQARERVEMTLTTLTEEARLALSHEDMEAALSNAERTIMNVLLDVWRIPAPRPGHVAYEGTWRYVTSDQGPGHYQLRDSAGYFVGYIVRRPDGGHEASFHKASLPPQDQ